MHNNTAEQKALELLQKFHYAGRLTDAAIIVTSLIAYGTTDKDLEPDHRADLIYHGTRLVEMLIESERIVSQQNKQ